MVDVVVEDAVVTQAVAERDGTAAAALASVVALDPGAGSADPVAVLVNADEHSGSIAATAQSRVAHGVPIAGTADWADGPDRSGLAAMSTQLAGLRAFGLAGLAEEDAAAMVRPVAVGAAPASGAGVDGAGTARQAQVWAGGRCLEADGSCAPAAAAAAGVVFVVADAADRVPVHQRCCWRLS
ncbi:hypothetical protein ABZ671_32565, partial [Micromonospora sp. NPDC006766]|uniref:hypothetical protein n=1 Tax=Micromonospora sp. NPDC006766 TaxID=3154778 RepID=UPI0034062418